MNSLFFSTFLINTLKDKKYFTNYKLIFLKKNGFFFFTFLMENIFTNHFSGKNKKNLDYYINNNKIISFLKNNSLYLNTKITNLVLELNGKQQFVSQNKILTGLRIKKLQSFFKI